MAEIKLFFIFIGSLGFDLLIGDPKFFIHPVQIIGIYINKITYLFINKFGESKKILFWGGFFIAFSTIFISFSIGKYLELIFYQSNENFIIGIIILIGLSSCLASKNLTESAKEISNLMGERIINQQFKKIIVNKVQKIVSRDVSSSSMEHLLRSTTESLTENSVDGIFGPLFWMIIGIFLIKYSIYFPGPLSLGFSYKAISTLDSMIGYKHDQYKYIGFFSAKIEDFATFIPCRLVLLTLPLVTKKFNKYFFIIKKSYLDGKKYDSPNSGISEAVFAYTLDIKLGGKSKYKDKIIEKPIINSNGNICNKEKIKFICQLILRLQLLWIIFFMAIYFIS